MRVVGAEGRDYEFENMYENDGARNGMKQLRIDVFCFFSFFSEEMGFVNSA